MPVFLGVVSPLRIASCLKIAPIMPSVVVAGDTHGLRLTRLSKKSNFGIFLEKRLLKTQRSYGHKFFRFEGFSTYSTRSCKRLCQKDV